MSMFRTGPGMEKPSRMASDDIDDPNYATPASKLQARDMPIAGDDGQADDQSAQIVDVDQRLAALARRITTAKKRMVDSVLTIGEALTEAQALLADHNGGSFNKWIRQRCNFTARTAYRYIKAFQTFGSCDSQSQRKFDVQAMHLLSDDNAPEKAVAEAIDLAGGGEKITTKVAKSLIGKHGPRRRKSPGAPGPLIIEVDGGTIAIRPDADDADIASMLMQAMRQFRSEGRQDAA